MFVTRLISSVLMTIFFYEKKLVRYDKEKARDLGQKFQADKMYLWIHKENELIIDCLIMEVNMFL